jgi:hypothetical protein
MVQDFILFLMIYTKLGHKLTNVGKARINERILILIIIERNVRIWTLQGYNNHINPAYTKLASNIL